MTEPTQKLSASQLLERLIDASRSLHIAIRRVNEAEVLAAGEQAHLANVRKYRANLQRELDARIAEEARAVDLEFSLPVVTVRVKRAEAA